MTTRTFLTTPAEFIVAVHAALPELKPQHDAHVKALDRVHHREWQNRAERNVQAATDKIIREIRARNGAAHQGERLQAAE